MSDLGAAKGRIVIDTSDINRAVNEVRRGSDLMTKTLSAIGIGTGIAAAKHIADVAFNLAEAAANANRTRSSFDALAKSVGQDAESMLNDMRKASRGMVSDADLVLHANQAMLLNVAKTGEELGQLLDAARVLGQAMGKDTAAAFNDLVIGLGRLSPRILDNLGIANEGEKTFSNYAKSIGKTAKALTDAEKKQALINQVMKAAQPLLDAEAKAGGNAADKFEQYAAQLENSKKALGDFLLEAGATDSLEKITDGFEESIKAIERFDHWIKTLKGDWDSFSESLGTSPIFDALAGINQDMQDALARFGVMIGTREPFGRAEANQRDIARHSGRGRVRSIAPATSAPAGFDEDQTELIVDRWRDIQEIEADAMEQRLDATRQYEEQRTSVIRDFGKMMAREAEDFALNRARQERDNLDQIADIHRDAGRREARQVEDLERTLSRARIDSAERMAEAREDTNKRLADLDEDFKREQTRREADFKDDMLSAAGSLDAIRLLELRKNRATELKERKEAHKEQVDDLKEQLDERLNDESKALEKSIANARETHERQLTDQREADAQRLEEMRENFEQRKADEDEDRAINLQRMAEDHQDQLDEMARQHALDLQQIAEQEQEKRDKVQTEFDAAMAELGIMTDAWIKENKRVTDAAIADYERVTKVIADAAALAALMQGGGGVRFPSLANPGVNLTRPIPPAGANSSVTSFNGNVNVVIAGSTNMGENEMYRVARRAFVDALEEAAGGGGGGFN